jgi:NAD-dependent oxidoreductase involved in siderophore biosynthesis
VKVTDCNRSILRTVVQRNRVYKHLETLWKKIFIWPPLWHISTFQAINSNLRVLMHLWFVTTKTTITITITNKSQIQSQSLFWHEYCKIWRDLCFE